jgi:ubiquinone/menaquinone biosynthesis C-methylase UbiE
MDVKKEVQKQFGSNAYKYITSPIHALGQDLAILLEVSEVDGTMLLLDVATGGGHVAKLFASVVQHVTAFDLTAEMLQQAQAFIQQSGHTNVDFVYGDAEQMPFQDGEFDRVICRVAAHHFPNINAFLSEVVRVLRPGGCLLLIDNVAPENDEYDQLYNKIEKQRDPSHFRAWKKSEWISFIEHSGLAVELMVTFPKTFEFEDWCSRLEVPSLVKHEMEQAYLQAAPDVKRYFHLVQQDGHLLSFQDQGVLLKARKPE